jgi:hypothetical protein
VPLALPVPRNCVVFSTGKASGTLFQPAVTRYLLENPSPSRPAASDRAPPARDELSMLEVHRVSFSPSPAPVMRFFIPLKNPHRNEYRINKTLTVYSLRILHCGLNHLVSAQLAHRFPDRVLLSEHRHTAHMCSPAGKDLHTQPAADIAGMRGRDATNRKCRNLRHCLAASL